MIKVIDIYDYLSGLYPLETACDFDNVGLLVGDKDTAVSSVVVALDCDSNAVERAKALGSNLIVTHHPVIFDPLKSVTAGSVVYELIKNGITVISMHTNLDIAQGGVNDCLCKALYLSDISVFTTSDGFNIRSATSPVSNPDVLAEHIKTSLGCNVRYVKGESPIKKLLVCSGSGGDYLDDAISGGFDALITADVKHHLFVEAANNGISLFDAGHYHTEDIVVQSLCDTISKNFAEITVFAHHSNKIKHI